MPAPERPEDVGGEVSTTSPDDDLMPGHSAVSEPHFTILHFNDAHNIVPPKDMEPLGSATRFATIAKQYRKQWDSLLLFSGDCFNPSRLSTVTKGRHVAPVMKALRVDCAVYGNHDFDFGPDELVKLAKDCGMPWVMTNVVDTRKDPPVPVCNSLKSHMIRKNGVRIGVIGIVEEEWLATIRDLPDYVQYLKKDTAAKAEIENLKAQGAQMIIALTHMREYNDVQFLKDVPEVDLLLGGHDHYYKVLDVGNSKLIKSSADFVHTTFIKVWVPRGPGGRVRIETEKIPVFSSIKEDPEIQSIVDSYDKELQSKINKEVCRLGRELDVMAEVVRTQECAAGNLVADIMRKEMMCDCAIVNSGVLRANLVYIPGVLKIKDILDILPMEDIVVSVLIKGSNLREALECGFSKYPALEGRFPQVSGMQMLMDPSKSPGERLKDLRVKGRRLDNNRIYKLATTSYLSGGGDGYLPLKEHSGYICEIENGRILPTMCRQYLADLPGTERKLEKKASKQELRGAPHIKASEREVSMKAIDSAYLPTISPTVDGRIFISDEMVELPVMSSNMSCSSFHSMYSDRTITLPRRGERRTSMVHPIPVRRTITNLTDNQFSHETQDDILEAMSNSSFNRLPPHKIDSHSRRSFQSRNSQDLTTCSPTSNPAADGFLSQEYMPLVEPEKHVVTLHDACAKGDMEAITALVKNKKANHRGSIVNKKGHATVMNHKPDDLKALGLGSALKDIATPLHYAVVYGRVAAVEFLLQSGAHPKIRTALGGTARELAFAHLLMAHSKGDADLAKAMEKIIDTLDRYEERMTDDERTTESIIGS
jgi:5'-nucleotidase